MAFKHKNNVQLIQKFHPNRFLVQSIFLVVTLAYLTTVQAVPVQWASPTDGIYNDGTSWSGDVAPGVDDDVVFNTGGSSPYTATLSADISNKSLSIENDNVVIDLSGNKLTLTANNYIGATGSEGSLTMKNGSAIIGRTLIGPGMLTIDNAVIDVTAPTSIYDGGSLNIINGSQYDNIGEGIDIHEGGSLLVSGKDSYMAHNEQLIYGEARIENGARAFFGSDGTFIGESGNLTVTGEGTTLHSVYFGTSGTVTISDGAVFDEHASGVNVQESGSFYIDNATVESHWGCSTDCGHATTRVDGYMQISNGGILDSDTYIGKTGEINLDFGTIKTEPFTKVQIDGGKLSGNGIIDSDLYNLNGGTVSPGQSPGAIVVTGDYIQDETSVFVAELGGWLPAIDNDLLTVFGTAHLDGFLDVYLWEDFMPDLDDFFTVIAADEIVGDFNNISLPSLIDGLAWGWGIDNFFGVERFNLWVVESESVPEPSTLVLLCVGLAGIVFTRRRRAAR